MKNHIRLTSSSSTFQKKTPACCHMKVRFRAIWETWATPPNISCFFKWKSKTLVCLWIFYKHFWVKNKDIILFTNHFDLGWKENSLIKIDWDPVELSRKTVMISTKPRPPRGVTWVNVGLECAAGLSEPLPHYSLLLIVEPILVTFGQICNFCDPNLVTFYFY